MNTIEMQKKEYKKAADELTPKSPIIKNCTRAFISGGLICTFAQTIKNLISNGGFSEDEVSLMVNMILIGIAAILTGMGLYSKLGKFCGAGTIVPITGFANSMVSPSIEYKTQGMVLGVGAKMFTVAGPVIAYGLSTSVVVGLVYYFFGGI